MPPAPKYPSFAAVTMLVLGLLVMLARASQAMFEGGPDGDAASGTDDTDADSDSRAGVPATGAARIERHRDTGRSRAERRARDVLDEDDGDPWNGERTDESPWDERGSETDARRASEREASERYEQNVLEFSTGTLLANVALSQGLFGVAIVGAAWLADVPPVALGVETGNPWSVGLPAVGVGVAVGVALYAANELAAKVVDAAGIDYSEGLRESLAPDTLGGWAVLLGVVLPVIAGFEELLFRAALVGAFAAGFGVSPWLLAAFSTVAFAIGHGAQGPGGVAVTGLLGFALAAAFVLTESLLVVVVAHYLVNALEFGVHEGLGIEWV
ncbi:CPBP family intramembrane metalloprotease [Halorussus limi]|uniref:CPBP family intramembrane metalloprotease n=1 Tax=Halorussus limi TaxID=2938695 RepID=A0A8U0HR68_9EURY|nr:CPBP family intramembrane glutamic endopeptidase [Halorussus limi]UPV73144.1 CPBP family intramembrane metalloprotease [Halorussus limi]